MVGAGYKVLLQFEGKLPLFYFCGDDFTQPCRLVILDSLVIQWVLGSEDHQLATVLHGSCQTGFLQ